MSAAPRLTPEYVERGYNNRAAVPDHPQWFARWAERSREAMSALAPRRDVRYGRGEKETLDLFVPPGTPRGVLAFIHGGYWRSLDKAEHAFVAPAFVREGIAVANLNYDLCPAVTIGGIVDEMRRATAYLERERDHLGLGRGPLVVAGHSAGGHLAAMLHATPAQAFGLATHPLRGSVSLSGVHDLAPLVQFSYNVDLRLDPATAHEWSPVNLRPAASGPVLIAVGANETGEFLRQSDLLWDAWPEVRPQGAATPLRIPERHHFDVVMDYAEPESALTRATLALF